MNSLRAAKKSKRTFKKITTQQQSPQEEAKQKLIELSNMWDYNQTQSNFNDNPEIILEQTKNRNQTYYGRKLYNTERTKVDVSCDFKKLSELLEEKPNIERLEVRSQRHYKYGDKFISLALRNPLTTSNYIMTGVNHARNSVSNPQRSQYVIRQQRNKSRIRREQIRREADNLLMEKNGDQFLSHGNGISIKFEAARSSIFNNLLKSQQMSNYQNKLSGNTSSPKTLKTTQIFRHKK